MHTLLIVDDNPNDRRGIAGLIDWGAHEIEVVGTAVHGEDGYRKALELRPDFIITDVAMPIASGIEMTARLKEELPESRFVFMSCFDDVDYLQRAIDLEVSAYVLKPIIEEELVQAVQKVRAVKRREDRRRSDEAALRQVVAESLPLLQEQFLKELLYGAPLAPETVRERAAYLKLSLEETLYAIAFVQIDSYDIHYRGQPMDRRHLLSYSLQRCVEQTMTRGSRGYATGQGEEAVVAWVKLDASGGREALREIAEAAQRCIEEAGRQLSVSVTIGVSHFSDRPEEAAELCRQAGTAAKSKFFSKGNQVIWYAEVGEPQAEASYRLPEVTEALRGLTERQDEGELEAFMERCYGREAGGSERYTKSVSYTIVNVLQSLLLEAGKSFRDVFEDELLLWRKLSLLETLEEIRSFVREVIRQTVQCLHRDEPGGKNSRIVDDIKRVIDAEYPRIENVNQIVENLDISASHANLVFKKVTGQTIFDYLTEQRVEAAKALLRNPYVKIYEVSEAVGYRTEAHFRSVFKAYAGMTPGKYQEKYSQ